MLSRLISGVMALAVVLFIGAPQEAQAARRVAVMKVGLRIVPLKPVERRAPAGKEAGKKSPARVAAEKNGSLNTSTSGNNGRQRQ